MLPALHHCQVPLMAETERWVALKCGECDWTATWNHHHAEQALTRCGMLRRAKQPDPELIWEIFPSGLARMRCPDCGQQALTAVPLEDESWPEARRCVTCSSPIPPERLAAIPNTEMCVACQAASDQGESDEPQEFCPKCGAPLVVRLAGGAGISRYRLQCTGSPPCRLSN